MKHFLFASTLLIALAPLSSNAEPIIDATVKQKIEVTTQTDSSDDYFIALARAGDMNFFADATVPFEPSEFASAAVQTPQKNTLLELLGDFAQEQRRSRLRYGARTYLFWHEPDVVTLVEPFLSGKGVTIPANTPSNEEAGKALVDYLQRERGWNGAKADDGLQIRLSELPLPLRQQVQSYAVGQMLERARSARMWLSEEFWDTVILRIGPDITGTNKERLFIVGIDKERNQRSLRPISHPSD